jgi:hypothetical protein
MASTHARNLAVKGVDQRLEQTGLSGPGGPYDCKAIQALEAERLSLRLVGREPV